MSRFNKSLLTGILLGLLLTVSLVKPVSAQSGANITAQDLINLVNGLRTGNGLPALEVSSILMSTAQSTAEIMAANNMGWHIGDVRGRVMAAGYGGGATAWATENFAIGPISLEDLAWMWSDPDHMIPMVKPAYQHIGAGVATAADGSIYYIVHAAYTSGSPLARTQTPVVPGATEQIPQWVIPVVTATPSSDGSVVHEVKMGQSLWSIAIAYDTHIVDILRFNNLSPEQQVVWIGQKLNIPVSQQPVTPIPTSEPTSIPSLAKRIAAQTNPTIQPALPSTPTAEPSPSAAAVTAPTDESPAATPANDMIILYVLGGIFIIGVILIIIGLLLKRPAS